ncbi:MAG TPA: WcaF family extracellular polysaccharide biosynthesis acetyltransferase [Dongiaceae bacterium]|nr:WcaF family extracellular polysaccharide biosynthesis acetyltransferase [Dongiaceae bacterium]
MNRERQGPSLVRNDLFDANDGFDLGRPRVVFAAWYCVKCVFFLCAFPWPSRLKSSLLRWFGAEVGRRVRWQPRVNIHIPWNLKVGDYTWVGEEACIINFAPVAIGAHCCLSQRCCLCSGNHDYRSTNMRYRHAPIVLEDGVWIGAAVFVGPGVTIGVDAVITAMSLVSHSVAGGMIYSGQPCQPVRRRWPEEALPP